MIAIAVRNNKSEAVLDVLSETRFFTIRSILSLTLASTKLLSDLRKMKSRARMVSMATITIEP